MRTRESRSRQHSSSTASAQSLATIFIDKFHRMISERLTSILQVLFPISIDEWLMMNVARTRISSHAVASCESLLYHKNSFQHFRIVESQPSECRDSCIKDPGTNYIKPTDEALFINPLNGSRSCRHTMPAVFRNSRPVFLNRQLPKLVGLCAQTLSRFSEFACVKRSVNHLGAWRVAP